MSLKSISRCFSQGDLTTYGKTLFRRYLPPVASTYRSLRPPTSDRVFGVVRVWDVVCRWQKYFLSEGLLTERVGGEVVPRMVAIAEEVVRVCSEEDFLPRLCRAWEAELKWSYYPATPTLTEDHVVALLERLLVVEPPPSVLVTKFLRETTVPGGRCAAKTLHSAFGEWCDRQGAFRLSLHQFTRAMVLAGHTKVKIQGYDNWEGFSWVSS